MKQKLWRVKIRTYYFGNFDYDCLDFQESKKEKALTDMDDPDFGGAWHGAVFYLSLEVTYGRRVFEKNQLL